jgi:hypothetical protein
VNPKDLLLLLVKTCLEWKTAVSLFGLTRNGIVKSSVKAYKNRNIMAWQKDASSNSIQAKDLISPTLLVLFGPIEFGFQQTDRKCNMETIIVTSILICVIHTYIENWPTYSLDSIWTLFLCGPDDPWLSNILTRTIIVDAVIPLEEFTVKTIKVFAKCSTSDMTSSYSPFLKPS